MADLGSIAIAYGDTCIISTPCAYLNQSSTFFQPGKIAFLNDKGREFQIRSSFHSEMLTGNIKDGDNNLIEGAIVVLVAIMDRGTNPVVRLIQQTISDVNGEYTFYNLSSTANFVVFALDPNAVTNGDIKDNLTSGS